MKTFQVYAASDEDLDHPTVHRSASKVLTRAITSKVDLTSTGAKLFNPLTLFRREEEYDPHKNRKVPKPTTYQETMTHLLKACFGAGMLALPNAISRLGLILGSVGVAFLGFFSCYCLQLLIRAQYVMCKLKKVGYMTFPDSMRMALENGPPSLRWSAGLFANSVNFLIIIWQLGVCAIYLVFVAENVKQILAAFGTEMGIRLLICCQYPFLVTICLIKDLKKLTPLSAFSNLCNLIGIVLVFYYLTYDDVMVNESHYKLKSLMDIPVFIGIVLFAIMAPGVILALEYNMENPKEFTGWCGLFSIGTIIIVVVYTAIGIFGYLKYGAESAASITLNLPQSEKKAQAAKLAFAGTIFTSFPLQNFVGWQTFWTMIKAKFNDSFTVDVALRVFCSSFPFVMALAAPALGPFIGLLGSLCLTIVAIIFPALVDICVSYPKGDYGAYKYKLITDILIMMMGVFCCGSGVYTSILEMEEALAK